MEDASVYWEQGRYTLVDEDASTTVNSPQKKNDNNKMLKNAIEIKDIFEMGFGFVFPL